MFESLSKNIFNFSKQYHILNSGMEKCKTDPLQSLVLVEQKKDVRRRINIINLGYVHLYAIIEYTLFRGNYLFVSDITAV